MSSRTKEDDTVSAIRGNLGRALNAESYDVAQAELQAGLERAATLTGPDRHNMELGLWMQYAVAAERWGDLETAVVYFEKLALAWPEESATQIALSTLYRKLGNAEKTEELVRASVELAERTGDRLSLAMLAAQGHLPTERNARAGRLEDAIQTYREALSAWTLEASPDLFAGTQTKLGDLCRSLAELLPGAARSRRLEEAAVAYQEALRVRTVEAFPEQYRVLVESLRAVQRLSGEECGDDEA